ncbi:hypothetical protein MTBPR1_180032 [Candidatus Terasakiella magnetica]|uniref:Uncharacterized protein n=1 Tax=Candidatus Terasakiella magnetica TaxID=1867952 RepID=A0A1C3RFT2_9PROT|nr:hypothetical protein MTBPR1_180032 [Candidatus Terasakiella magnetica]
MRHSPDIRAWFPIRVSCAALPSRLFTKAGASNRYISKASVLVARYRDNLSLIDNSFKAAFHMDKDHFDDMYTFNSYVL